MIRKWLAVMDVKNLGFVRKSEQDHEDGICIIFQADM